MLNLPPRFGKTRTLVLFCEWILGRDNTERIIATSFNDKAAHDFSKYTRDGIQMKSNFPDDMVFHSVFPDTQIKYGDASYEKWALEGQFFNYLGAGIGGTIMGKGGTYILEDDLVKNAWEAYNDLRLEEIWKWRTGTLLSRKEESDGKQALEILNGTRWASKDPCGRILNDPVESKEWHILSMEALNEETGELLCPSLLSMEGYLDLERRMDPVIFRANYHQAPVDIKGTLYKDIKLYGGKDTSGLPETFDRIISYTDTADEGNDYLVTPVAGEKDGEAWLLDVYMTKEGMEITEPATAEFLNKNAVNIAKIESNNGGRGFSRAVQKILADNWIAETKRIENDKENVKNGEFKEEDAFTDDDRTWSRVPIKWFHQTENKRARIMTNSNFIMQHFYFPWNWRERWPEFYVHVTEYQREGKSRHDDAPDALTGLAEMVQRGRPRARLIG